MKSKVASFSFNLAVRLIAFSYGWPQNNASTVVTTERHDLGDGVWGENGELLGGKIKTISVRRLVLAFMALAICINSVQAYAQTEAPVGPPSTLPAPMRAKSNAARARVIRRPAAGHVSSNADPVPLASGPTSQQVGPPILFAHGICGHPNDWDSIRISLAAYLQKSHSSLYPNPNMYVATASGPTIADVLFWDENGTQLTSIPSDARFFSIGFIDPVHPNWPPQTFVSDNVMGLSISEKGDELAQAITAIKLITGVPKVMLIGHSMGGLDARSYLENLGGLGSHKPQNDSDVVALTTIDTPHLGSPFAVFGAIMGWTCGDDSSKDNIELLPDSSMISALNYNDSQAQDIPATVAFDSIVNYVLDTDILDDILYAVADNECQAVFQGVGNDGAVCRASQNLKNALAAYPPFWPQPNVLPPNEFPFVGTCPTRPNRSYPGLLHSLDCIGAQVTTQQQLAADIITNLLHKTIDVEPQGVVLNSGQTQQFSSQLNGASPSVNYILLEDPTSTFIKSDDGLFTASDTGVFHVVATDTATGKQYGMATVTVNPSPQISTLQVNFAGSGTGEVSSNPQGIACRADCSYTFPSNASVTLTAWPDSGMVVSGWSGCGTQTQSTCKVSMASSRSVTVTFVTQQSNQLPPPILNAVQIFGSPVSPQGTFSWSQVTNNAGYRILVATQQSALPSDPNIPYCGPSCVINLTVGANVTTYTSAPSALSPGTTYYWQVHALGSTGYSPGVWSKVGTFSTSQSAGQVQVTLQGSGTGTVTSTPTGINCPGACSASFPANTAVTLFASASPGSQFLQWGGACAGASCTVSATGIQTVFANFSLNANYTLTLGVSGSGTVTSTDGRINCTNVSGSCSASYPNGRTVVLNGAPGTNYALGGWSGACTGAGGCSVVMNQNQFVMAAFNVSSQPNGQLTVSTPSFAPVFNQGTAPATIGLLVKNSSGGPMLGTAVASEQSGGAWMTADGGASDNWSAPETLMITFNPAGLSPGIYNGAITLTSKQATNSQVVVSVTMTVLSPLLITTAPGLPDAFSGKPYSTTLQASGGTGLTWSVDPNALPSGLTLDGSTGVISGTPGNIGGNSSLTFVVSVTDSSFRLAQQTFTMNWRQGVDIELFDNSLLQMTVGSPLYQSAGTYFIATGGIAPYTWSATGLPPGVLLSSTGAFSGSPTTLGQFNIILTATDSTGLSGSLSLAVTTNEILLQIYDSSQNTPPLLKPIVLGVPLTSSEYMVATGGTQAGYSWTINGALPPGVGSGSTPGCTTTTCALLFTGTPIKAGAYSFVVQVTDSQTNSTSSSQTWIVNSDALGPKIGTTVLPRATIGQNYTQQLAASGGVAPLTWRVLSGHLDPSLSVSSSGALSGTPSAPNECANGGGLAPRGSVPNTFVVEVTDSNGESDLQQLCITSYFPLPTLQAVSPQTIVPDGTARVLTVTGTGFQPLSQLWVQYTQQPTVYVSPTELQVTLQPGSASPFNLAGGSQLPPANLQIRVQAPYTMPSSFGSFTIALPPPTVAGIEGSYGNTGAPCTPNFICEFVISGSGFSYQTTFQVSGSSQSIGILQAPNALEPWTRITATNFVPPGAGSYTVQVTNPNQAGGGSATASGTVQVYADGSIVPAPASFAPTFTQGDAGSSTALLVQVAGIPNITGTVMVSTQNGGNWLTVGGQLSGSWTAGTAMYVSFNPAGLAIGNYSGTITLNWTNATGGAVTVPVNMVVLAPLSILTPLNLPGATTGQPFATTLAGAGGNGLVWSVVQGFLPTGLALGPTTGIVSGTPTIPVGSSQVSFTIGLTDSLGRFTSRVFSMNLTWIGVSVSIAGNGTVTSNDFHITCGPNCSYSYRPGSTVRLTAIPAPGSTFSGWTGCNSNLNNVCIVSVNGAQSVTAGFASVQVGLSSLQFKPSTVRGGHMTIGTLTLSSVAPSGGVTVGLTSSQRSIVFVPATIYIRGGQSTFGFAARTRPARKQTVTVTAIAGSASTSGSFTLLP